MQGRNLAVISTGALSLVTVAVAVLFVRLFNAEPTEPVNFWWHMAAVNILLVGLAAMADRTLISRILGDIHGQLGYKIFMGLISAVLLYGFFLLGSYLVQFLSSGAGDYISRVYQLRELAPTYQIALLLVCIIGPGEELLWRATLQHNYASRWGSRVGLVAVALLYTLVHLPTGNPILIIAALTCGLFWGVLYELKKSITVNVVSHVVWDLAVFLVFPLPNVS